MLNYQTNYHERGYYGYCNGVERYLQTVVYYKREVFKTSPILPELIIGNYGTLINREYLGMKCTYGHNSAGDPTIHTNVIEPNGIVRKKEIRISTIVMLAHDPLPDIYSYKKLNAVCLNGNKMQNIFDPGTPWHNLKWMTYEELVSYQYTHGLRKNADNSTPSGSLLTDELAHKICQLISQGYKNPEIANILGIEQGNPLRESIAQLRNRNVKRSIVSQYQFPAPSKQKKHTEEEVMAICELLQLKKYTCTDIYKILVDRGMDIDRWFAYRIKDRAIPGWSYITDRYNY